MKTKLTTLLITLVAGQMWAGEVTLQELDWKKLADGGALKSGKLVDASAGKPGESVLKIERSGGAGEDYRPNVVVIENPAITTNYYALVGEVSYEDVAGDGFLEMWNHFGPDTAYFSRTLGTTGQLQKLTGKSDWRPFSLPFNAEGAKGKPSKLDFNVQLPTKGTVYLRNVRLVQADSFAGVMKEAGAWWSDSTGGMIGGIGGVAMAAFFVLIQVLGNRTGVSPVLTARLLQAMVALGGLLLVAGIVAACLRQPYGVYYVLLLSGALSTGLGVFRLRQFQLLCQDIELRRISSMDAVV